MDKQLTRKEYIESEYTKWTAAYEISFEQEFEVKALLNLQYQFMVTPHDHVKTQGDLIHTINQIKKNLNLKTKISQDKPIKILALVNNRGEKDEMYNLFYSLLQYHTITMNLHGSRLVTKDFDFRVESNLETARGMSADFTIDLTKKHTS